jgi:hypothetical protein
MSKFKFLPLENYRNFPSFPIEVFLVIFLLDFDEVYEIFEGFTE